MRYLSTRDGVAPHDLSSALLAGLAPDGGLFVPERMPRAVMGAVDAQQPLARTAATLLRPFFADSELDAELAALCDEAFTFDAPLAPTTRADTEVLELFHGPTAAFKDYGARFLAACLRRLGDMARQRTVLVATSGDTGGAVAAAFHRMPGVRVAILYPDGLVSPRQAHQLGCFGDNVHALRVAGTFDDCQRLVKAAFADAALRRDVPLASANSISLGRLLPQMAYYAHAALRWRARRGEDLSVIVPTGNLGNACAALWAQAMGLPIREVMLATNANRGLVDYVHGAGFEARSSRATLANAMDVGNPSNIERVRWLFGGDALVRERLRADSVGDDDIRMTIARGERDYGMVWCPHTACAVQVRERLRAAGDARAWCVVATAHPAKFETVVEPLLGRGVEPPAALAAMLARVSRAEPLAADSAALATWLRR
jgi:threonine synthase